MILHHVFNSPFSTLELHNSMALCQAEDAILLLQDGVYALNHPLFNDIIARDIRLYIVHHDLIARGLALANTATNNVEVISDEQWLALCVKFNKIISWS